MQCPQIVLLLLCGFTAIWADRKTALVLVAPGFEEIGMITLVTELRRFDFEVKLARLDNSSEVVRGQEDVGIVIDSLFPTDQEKLSDVIILPDGSKSVQTMRNSQELREVLKAYEQGEKCVVAIGKAPLVLMEFDLFPGHTITAHLPLTAELATKYKIDSRPVVKDGTLFTCQAPRHTLKLAGKLIKKLLDNSGLEKKSRDSKKPKGRIDDGKPKQM